MQGRVTSDQGSTLHATQPGEEEVKAFQVCLPSQLCLLTASYDIVETIQPNRLKWCSSVKLAGKSHCEQKIKPTVPIMCGEMAALYNVIKCHLFVRWLAAAGRWSHQLPFNPSEPSLSCRFTVALAASNSSTI